MSSIKLVRFADKIVGRFLSIFSFSKKKELNECNNILIIQLWGIGETILTLPLIKSVHNQYPNSKITILATDRNKEVYLHSDIPLEIEELNINPFSILKYISKNRKKYDLVIDLEEYLYTSSIISFFTGKHRIGYSNRKKFYNQHINYNDNQHVTKTFLDLGKLIECQDSTLSKLSYTEKDKRNISKILDKYKGKKIGIVPGTAESAKSRMWPRENFKELSNKLKEHSLIFIGSKSEKPLINEIIEDLNFDIINLAGSLSLGELFCLIDNLDLLITNDTGPLHIASAQNTPTIALFGPNTPVRFGPLAQNSHALYQPDCKFSPCVNVHKGQVPDCLPKMKNNGYYQHCMKQNKVEDVLKLI